MSIEAPGTAPLVAAILSSISGSSREQNLGAPPSNLRAPPDWQRSDRQPAYEPVPSRRSAAPPPEIETEELPPYASRRARRRWDAATGRAAVAAARSAAQSADGHGDADRGEARGDARVPDCLRARSLVRQRGAARGAQVVQSAGGRGQADLGLFVPRHERPGRRAYFRARLRQRARHRGLRAGRRSSHHGQGRLERARRRSRAFSATCRARPAISSPPCWRRAPTNFTTTTSTST